MSFAQNFPPIIGQARQREMLKSATTYTYFETDQGPVQAHFFAPEDLRPGEMRPLVIFFHGGFWDSPMASQFAPYCLHLASRGVIAVAAETRVFNIHRTGALDALEDTGKFMDWLAQHYVHFNIDPKRVTVAGAAGGALLALSLVMPKVPKGGQPHPLAPSGAVLLSSLLDATAKPAFDRFPDKKSAKTHSPLKLVRRKLPPMILFHGKNDRVTPFETVRKFHKALRWRRNDIEVVEYEGADHAFFNFNVSELHYELVTETMDRFLEGRGLIPPAPAVEELA